MPIPWPVPLGGAARRPPCKTKDCYDLSLWLPPQLIYRWPSPSPHLTMATLTYSLWPPSPTHYGHPHLLTMATLTYSLWSPSPTHFGHPHLLTMATSPTHYGHPHLLPMATLTYSLWPPHVLTMTTPLPLLITVNYNKHQIKDQLFMQTCRVPLKLTLYLQLVHTPCYAYSMDHLISFSPSSQLTKAQWELLWKEHCSTIPEALPKFLQCVDWASLEQVQEAHRLLKIWRSITMEVC